MLLVLAVEDEKQKNFSKKKHLRACEIHDKYFLQIFVKELGSTEGYVY